MKRTICFLIGKTRWDSILKQRTVQGHRKLFLVGGLKLKFGGPSRALQVRGFIGEMFYFRVYECNMALDFTEDLIEFWP